LLIDLDSQGNATSACGIDKKTVTTSIYDLLIGEAKVDEVMMQSGKNKFSLVPANNDLMAAEIQLLEYENREFLLKNALLEIQGKFDYIIIDSPPSMNILTLNAMAASNNIIIPVQCEYYALEGMTGVLETIYRIKETINPGLEISGVVRTMFDSRNSLAGEVSGQLKRYFGEKLFWTSIPRNVRLAEAPSFGLSAIAYDPECLGSKAYVSLAKEVVKKSMQ
jgi:chromosome partitioning protein